MFRSLEENIKALNADVKNVANCEKAKNLRRKLLSIGLPLTIIGYGGTFACFVLFATAGFDAFGPNGFTPRVLIPFFLMLPFALIGVIGVTISKYGFKIVITGYTSNLIDETVGNNCPKCGNTIDSDMNFCPKCGEDLVNECPKCGHGNDYKSNFCEKCGEKLK